MRTHVKWGLFVLTCAGFLLAAAGEAQAWPDEGGNCAGCHRVDKTDAMAVTNYDGLLSIDGGAELKYFDVVRGNTVTLSLDVTNGADWFAVKLDGLGGGGVGDVTNKLIYSDANAVGNPWTDQGPGNYFTKDAGDGASGIGWSAVSHPSSYTFDLFVDAATPIDIYELEFLTVGIGGGTAKWSGGEPFYLRVTEVVPEPASWVLFSCLGLGLVWYGRRRKR